MFEKRQFSDYDMAEEYIKKENFVKVEIGD